MMSARPRHKTNKAKIAKFNYDEHVLCFHGKLLYDVKILQRYFDDRMLYHVHYIGWSVKWDEWVPESQLLKRTAANVQRQEELYEQLASVSKRYRQAITKIKQKKLSQDKRRRHIAQSKAAAVPTGQSQALVPAGGINATPKRRVNVRKRQRNLLRSRGRFTASLTTSSPSTHSSAQSNASSSSAGQRAANQFELPSTSGLNSNTELAVVKVPHKLHQLIHNDYVHVMRQRRLQKLPADISVTKIIAEYLDYRCHRVRNTRSNNSTHEMVVETLQRVENYFDAVLADHILYSHERNQYSAIEREFPQIKPSQLYGGFHLMRIFAECGLLRQLQLNPAMVKILEEFLRYVNNHPKLCLQVGNYINEE